MTIAEQLLDEGCQEGETSLLSRLLKRRLPRAVMAKYLALVDSADKETLAVWAQNLLEAKNIEEVFSMNRPLYS